MATTGIWKIEKRLDHVINYIVNEEKTISSSSYKELHNLKEYENLDCNTEETCYVSGINCTPHTAYKDMMFTKEQYSKKNGILGYHAFQSFKEGEITPDKAHLIGLKLAEELWGDKYEVVVTTHVNTSHIHNHFVINSVSFVDGKKYHDCHETYALMRETSDALCQEYGLSVLDKKSNDKGKVKYSNYYKGYIANSNYHTLAKQDLDRAITMAYSYKDFENLMIKMGYEVITRYGKLSIRREPYKKNIRIERAFGIDYSIEEIEKRIENTIAPRVPFIEAYNPNNKPKKKTYKNYKREKSKGIEGLYKYYCYLLKIYPEKYPKKVLTPELRLEVNRLKEISMQTELLAKKHIQTYEQLSFYMENLDTDIKQLLSKREYLWKKYKRVKNEDKKTIRSEIDEVTKKLENSRIELSLCEGIAKRSGVVEKNIDKFEQKQIKERKK